MRTSELKHYIRKHSALFWYIPQEKKAITSLKYIISSIYTFQSMHKEVLNKNQLDLVEIDIQTHQNILTTETRVPESPNTFASLIRK